jgi:hypothetical protein
VQDSGKNDRQLDPRLGVGVRHVRRAAVGVVIILFAATACGADDGTPTTALPTGAETVQLDPGQFTNTIDNPYWPMTPGNRWVYRETDAEGNVQRVDVTVTSRTKRILGIEARVVHDVVTQDGQVQEDTFDWYAQDSDGNVWYLGEDTKEYEDGKLKSTEGSWQAGVDGAQAGVLLPADPKPGLAYRQEYYEGEAEDAAEVVSLTAEARVPYGSFDDVLMTEEHTPLEPKLRERKFYARGVGPVLAVTVSGGSGREVLVAFERRR